MSKGRRYPALADESGQVLVLAAAAMIMLLAVTGFALDFGHAYLVQRQLQSGVDAAALAGAQHLPLAAEVIPVAQEYGPSQGSRNATTTVKSATTTVTMRCVQSAPGCQQASGNYNAVRVDSTAPVRTLFGRVIGINSITVRATATACSPCSAKPLDIVIALDRTGSMCQTGGRSDPSCTDLNNAKAGIRAFLGYMDPTLDKVGLVLHPPALNDSSTGWCPYTPWQGNSNPNPQGTNPLNGRYFGYDAWWPYWDTAESRGQDPAMYTIASMTDDYLVQSNGTWILNNGSTLVQRLGCARGAGSTHYASAIEEAQHELARNGRGNVQDVIVFLSDGAANTSPTNLPSTHWRYVTWHDKPCGAGVQAATNAKNGGVIVYTIGYDLSGGTGSPERCQKPIPLGSPNAGHQGGSTPEAPQAWGSNAKQALIAMATDDCSPPANPCPNFYERPTPGDMRPIFTKIAQDLQKPASRLIDDNTP